jgi:hypothetical protein
MVPPLTDKDHVAVGVPSFCAGLLQQSVASRTASEENDRVRRWRLPLPLRTAPKNWFWEGTYNRNPKRSIHGELRVDRTVNGIIRKT